MYRYLRNDAGCTADGGIADGRFHLVGVLAARWRLVTGGRHEDSSAGWLRMRADPVAIVAVDPGGVVVARWQSPAAAAGGLPRRMDAGRAPADRAAVAFNAFPFARSILMPVQMPQVQRRAYDADQNRCSHLHTGYTVSCKSQ